MCLEKVVSMKWSKGKKLEQKMILRSFPLVVALSIKTGRFQVFTHKKHRIPSA